MGKCLNRMLENQIQQYTKSINIIAKCGLFKEWRVVEHLKINAIHHTNKLEEKCYYDFRRWRKVFDKNEHPSHI